MTYRFNKF